MKRLNVHRIRLVLAGSIVAIVLGGTGPANGATITVGPAGGYDFSAIQMGIDAAVDGDTVLVAPGEYIITEPITFRGKAIIVKSEAGPDVTIIRMGTPADINRGSVVIFENNETPASVLDGFKITGGSGSNWPDLCGGGIVFNASSATVRNCTIVQNMVKYGGGVFCVYPCSPSLIDCTIAENIAVSGDRGLGGGVCCYDNSSIIITGCTIINNMALAGGGVLCGENSSVTMTHCVIVGNTADWGGGLATYSPGSTTAVINCTNCTIWGNSASISAGGVGCYQGGASATVTNSIFWGNTAPKGDQSALTDGASTLTVTYSNVAGGQDRVTIEGGSTLNWGAGNIDVDPYFADPTNDDYHLKSQAGRWDPNSQTWVWDEITSPCIDTGDPMNPIGWELFPNGGFVNMGAYGGTTKASKSYFGGPVCETIVAGDINGDGQVNRADLEIMTLHWTDDEPLPLP
jgi:hypothetical protein